jgi:acetylornithine deacetylase/succinyl-diaminopimelate desuccinylase-like protein
MIETDTSITSGSCTLLADKIEKGCAAGYGEGAITRFAVPDHPKEGGIVAVLPGTNAALKPLLLLGHIDVVTAKREDWTRNPYQFIEEGGYFYGRGTADMKMLDAVAGYDDPLQARELSPRAPSSWPSPAARKPAAPSTARSGWPKTSAT